MPPSPWWSARKISSTYLSVTTSTSAQRMTDTAPTMFGPSSGTPANGPKTSLMVYNGLVDRKKHTSELQSLMRISYAVFCLKKKQQLTIIQIQLRIKTQTNKC